MQQDPDNLAESVRSGRYFQQSRAWYQTLFFAPIGERTIFLVIALLAAFVAVMALLSLSFLLPVTSRVPFNIYVSERPDDVLPRLKKLRPAKGDVNTSLSEFFVQQYVAAREYYTTASFKWNYAFVKGQSTPAVFEAYKRAISPENPESPINALGKDGVRLLKFTDVDITRNGEKGQATLKFVDELRKEGKSQNSRWTAKLDFTYTDLVATETQGTNNVSEPLAITDPKFQVTRYEVQRNQ